jgi:uncharacterized protein YhaN
MSDSIKIFIQQHREAFDEALPGAHGWTGLARMLDRLPDADGLEKTLMCNRILMDTEVPSETLWDKIEQELDQSGGNTLESFIRQNREAFDQSEPGKMLWENISGQLPKPKAIKVHIGWQRHLARIAASLALLVVGIGGGIWYERHGASSDGMAMSDVSSEYAELEQFYQRNITVKEEKLATFTSNQPTDVYEDLEHLDEVMEQLRKELATVPPGNREQVVRAMIENYKAKTAILQRVLERLEVTSNGGNNRKQSNAIKNI